MTKEELEEKMKKLSEEFTRLEVERQRIYQQQCEMRGRYAQLKELLISITNKPNNDANIR